mmetsp:Transcript_51148/g.144074  ORF Transcript_51148/g.144074 Transcript_51148/m.144074 type:complete len:273 (-) Transcript_51148:431-1249(-)|eukprot:CAMPEP_0179218754 /NCGR_PEP_ID=MMETSP0797-20121207/4642_1 /TAXON_ID=47934 /ORGANISM="Dinophysis acuminata, Strain DAEP01" /LENGTH=272 /DNA_ID=CAMNT_0020925123 /DNA_START=71 /DNA_END=889 /DNA_ORIENTATION=+
MAVQQAAFASGCACGALGCLVGHPLDTLKVRAQAGKMMWAAPWKLYRGIELPLVTAGLVNSLFYGVYESTRLQVGALDLPPFSAECIAGSVAGLACSAVSSPVSRVKVDQQVNGAPLLPTLRRVCAGGSLYRGFPVTVAFELTSGPYMLVYAVLKERLAVFTHSSSGEDLPLWARVAAAMATDICWWSAFYPVDVVRNRQQAALGPGAAVRRGAAQRAGAPSAARCARELIAEGGVARLYRGLPVALLRAGPVAAVTLPTFDVITPWISSLS